MHEVMIIGGGPAGIAAGIYSARKRLKTLFLTYEVGGQSTVSSSVENWIGEISVSGPDLGRKFKEHLESYQGEFLDIFDKTRITKLEKIDGGFKATAEDGQTFESQTVILATGASRRKLDVPGAKEYEHKGITYCATCDAPLFEGKDVVVIGGGNAGFETASQLTAYAKSVTIIEQNPEFRAEKITVDKLLAHPKVKGITGAKLIEIKGDQFVTGLVYQNPGDETKQELPIQGIFVEIGSLPESSLVQELVELNKVGAIITDPRTGRTSLEGIWAAGDNTDTLYHQNNIAAGQGVTALEDIYNYLLKK